MDEAQRLGNPFDIGRLMSKATFPLLTDGIKKRIPKKAKAAKKEGIYFASEVDMLNQVLFGITAKEWSKKNPTLTGNMRNYATAKELIILSGLQGLNERLLKWECDQSQRFDLLTEASKDWKTILGKSRSIEELTTRIDKQKNLLK